MDFVRGDPRGRYEAFAREHYDDVLRKAAFFVGWENAKDVAQEVFLKLWKQRALDRYEERGAVKGWLFSVRMSCVIDRQRKKGKLELLPSGQLPDQPGEETPLDAIERSELRQVVASAIAGSKHAEAFVEY